MCVEGSAEITQNGLTEVIKMGETVLIPANSKEVTFNGDGAKFLEVYIDGKAKQKSKKAS